MKAFINYIIEAGLSLGIFTLIYWFILRGETRFQTSRLFLLFALLFSTILPFLTIHLNIFSQFTKGNSGDLNAIGGTNLLETVTIYASGFPAKLGTAIMTFDFSMIVYQLGALAAFFVISAGIIQLILMVSRNRVYKLKRTFLVVSSKLQSTYSFFNYIFIGKDLTEHKNWKSVVHHELEHVKQGHSFDVLFVDLMMVFQWYNPFYWMLRRMVRENHEFLADTGVLAKGKISGARYKELLLSQAIGGHSVMTSNFLNVKTVKKRFKMINNNKTKKYGFLKYSFGVVLALGLTLMFACEDLNSIRSNSNHDVIIYKGEMLEYSQLKALNIQHIQLVEAEMLDVKMLYPQLSESLTEGNYQLAFDADDAQQMMLFAKLEIKHMESKNKVSDETVVVGYGLEKSVNIDEEVHLIVDDMPEFPGGEIELRKAIGSSVIYPDEAKTRGIQGKVYITFVVGSSGYIHSAKVARGVDPVLDNEALRVINALPKWKPGYINGKAVGVSYTVPINFQLQ